jgi:hypothetical protein
MSTLNRLETVTAFSEFVKLFGVYGSQMVELAHLTGDRQNVNQILSLKKKSKKNLYLGSKR